MDRCIPIERDELAEELEEAISIEGFQDAEGSETDPVSRKKLAAVSSLAIATAACGGGESGSDPLLGGGPIIGGGGPTVITPDTDAQAARFGLRAALSISEGDISEMRSEGYETWLEREMSQSIELTSQQFLSRRGFEDVNDEQYYFRRGLMDYMIWNQLLSGGNSVRKRVALALSEFFVVSVNPISFWPASAMGQYWDVLKEGAFGNFRDLLEEISVNPAMGVFLNTRGNKKANADFGRVPDENYSREVMQLFSIGLFELNLDGSVRTDGSGNPLETYDNDDVTGLAKVFTGYDYNYSGLSITSPPSRPNQRIPEAALVRRRMTADNTLHQPGRDDEHSREEKSFLGTTIPAGTGAEESLRIAMDTLFNHPNVGPFFGKQMIQRLVTSNPSPAYVQRVAETFNDNGSGVRGDLRAVFKAILLDEEALSDSTLDDTVFGKLREPMLRFIQWGRTFGITSTSNNWEIPDLSDSSGRLGQAPLRSPSVFNFFRPGYTPANSQAAENNLLAPEFQLVNETTAAAYINFMERTVEKSGFWLRDLEVDYQAEVDLASDTTQLLDRLDLLLTANQLSQFARDTITGALDATLPAQDAPQEDKLRQVHRAVFLVMASNDYLIQK